MLSSSWASCIRFWLGFDELVERAGSLPFVNLVWLINKLLDEVPRLGFKGALLVGVKVGGDR